MNTSTAVAHVAGVLARQPKAFAEADGSRHYGPWTPVEGTDA